MLGRNASVVIVGLLALCAGCTLPCHPFDYNGPVYDGDGQFTSNARAGSILDSGDMQPLSAGPDQSVIEEGVVEETASGIERNSPKVAEYEGARQTISVTDRKLEESESLGNSQPDINQSMPIIAQPPSAKLRWR